MPRCRLCKIAQTHCGAIGPRQVEHQLFGSNRDIARPRCDSAANRGLTQGFREVKIHADGDLALHTGIGDDGGRQIAPGKGPGRNASG